MSDIDHATIFKQQVIERKEDMSPDGSMRLFVDNSGDMCISVQDDEGNVVSVEFCTPFIGGGGSPKTFKALQNLFLAMLEDQEKQGSLRAGRFEVVWGSVK